MGYTTRFTGKLSFTTEGTASQLAALKALLGKDCRKHPELNAPGLCYIDLELTDDFSGLQWNGAEKTYDLDKMVNVVIREMRKKWPGFGLTGSLLAQGEDIEDRWTLAIGADGMAIKAPVVVSGAIIKCPGCGHRFELESD